MAALTADLMAASCRKDTNNLQNVGTAASKLLYTLHWMLLDAAEECADADREAGSTPRGPFPYIFPLTCVQEFVYLFAPLRHLLKEADLQNFRLENGLKIWPALWDYRHPGAQCFTAPVRPKKSGAEARERRRRAASDGPPAAPGQPNSTPAPCQAAPPAPNPPVNPLMPSASRDSVAFNDIFIGTSSLLVPLSYVTRFTPPLSVGRLHRQRL